MIKIGSKIIADNSPVFIIAEAGVNHNGSLAIAKKLVDAAKKAGADAVKFQTFKAEQVVSGAAKLASYQKKNVKKIQNQLQLLKKLELKLSDFVALKKYCDKKKIIFLSTPHSFEAVDQLKLLVEAFKVGSGDLTNIPLLAKIAKLGKPIFLSTGMADLKEIKQAVKVIESNGNKKIIILHCTSNYPCPSNQVNLKAMLTIKKTFSFLVGYSDHTLGRQASVMAVVLGAKVIEKHFTLDKSLAGPDHRASAEPQELEQLVKQLRLVPEILGHAEKKPTRSELLIKKQVRKSLVALKPIKVGDKFSVINLGIKRPGSGLPPKYFSVLLGKKAKRNITADKLISKHDYAS